MPRQTAKIVDKIITIPLNKSEYEPFSLFLIPSLYKKASLSRFSDLEVL